MEVYSGDEVRLYVENVRGNVGDKFQHRLTLSLRSHVLFTLLQKYIQKHMIPTGEYGERGVFRILDHNLKS